MPEGYRKEGTGLAFWIIIVVLGIAIAIAAWFYLKREEKPATANPSQSMVLPPRSASAA
jgi:hypothetical protein